MRMEFIVIGDEKQRGNNQPSKARFPLVFKSTYDIILQNQNPYHARRNFTMEHILESRRFAKAREQAEAMLKKMSLTEKVGQLSQFGTSIYSEDEQSYEDHFTEGKVGSYLTIRGAERTNGIQKMLLRTTRLPIPALFADDVIHGYRTTFPTPIAQSCTWNPEVTRRCNEIAAKEACRGGLKWTFAPMVDIARDPRWGRIMEGYGEDPYLCGRFSEAAVKGYQGEGEEALGKDRLLACMKHFAAYGACIGGRDYNSADMSDQTLYDVYLPSFQAGLDAGAATVMSAFEDLNGVPATANRYLLTEILREQMGFQGFVVSDAGAVHELVPHGFAENEKDAACKAFSAGCDMLMAGDLYNDSLPELLAEGKITEEQIDNSVRTILTMKYLCGLMEDPYVEEEGENCFFCAEHMAVAREAGRECAVLLENNGILPLSAAGKKIALVGPLATDDGDSRFHLLGGWACMCDPSQTVTVSEGLRKALDGSAELVTAKGCPMGGEIKAEELEEAVRLAAESDFIIAVVGEEAGMSGEAASLAHLELPSCQRTLINALIDTGKPVVLLVSAGRPLLLQEFKDRVAALMLIWQMGSSAGDAVADLLLGKASPSGHLTVSFPVCEGQIPVYYNYHNTGRPARNQWQFESKYRDCDIAPLYPFGYGKSYTEFLYEHIRLSTDTISPEGAIEITLTVRNVGGYPGAAVVQLYVRDLVGSRVRPVRELKGFEKVFLSVGETQKVTLRLEASSLAFHNDRMEKVVEPGEFKLWIAEHALDCTHEFSFRVSDGLYPKENF